MASCKTGLRSFSDLPLWPRPNQLELVSPANLMPEEAVAAVLLVAFEGDTCPLVNMGQGWSFPGGPLEGGETPEEAAARHLFDATGASLTGGAEMALGRLTHKGGAQVVSLWWGIVQNSSTPCASMNIAGWRAFTPEAARKQLDAFQAALLEMAEEHILSLTQKAG